MNHLYLLLLVSFSFAQSQLTNSDYVCFQGGNALCPNDHEYQIFYDSQNLSNYLLNNINNQNTAFTIFIANTKQEIVFLNCSLMPSYVKISGYSDSYACIDFEYSFNSDKSKRYQNITIENLKVKSVRSEANKNQNKLRAIQLNLLNVNFMNEEPLEIEADDIKTSFNSLHKVSKINSDKTITLSGLPSNNNEDLNLAVSINAETLILESFNDNASIDFLSKQETDSLYSLIQFKSFKNSLITVSSDIYNIFLNYDTYLSFYYDISDSSIKSLSQDTKKVNININSENAHVLFSNNQWPSSKTLNDHHDDDHNNDDHNNNDYYSIEFEVLCRSNATIESSAHYVPLNVDQCKNPHLIFNDLSASINSLELSNEGNAIIENRKNGGEVVFIDHVTFSPGAHLQIDDSVSKVRVPRVKSEFKTLPAKMTVNGHFEVDSCEFEILEYSVSFEYSPFSPSQPDKVCAFVVPASRAVLNPIEVRKIEEGAKFNIRLSDNFLNEKYNDQITSQFINKCANVFVNMNLDYFTFYIEPNSQSNREWNEMQKKLVFLYEYDEFVALKLSGLPSLYASTICLYKENDTEAEMLCEIDNFIPFKVVKLTATEAGKVILDESSNSLYYAKISEMTRSIKNVSIFLSSSDITLNLDGIESTTIQGIKGHKRDPLTVVIDNTNQLRGTKSLSLKSVDVSFKDKALKYDHLTLDQGTTVKDISSLSFKGVSKLSADASILNQLSKSEVVYDVFGNVIETITFVDGGFVFVAENGNKFEIDADEYKNGGNQFIFNESNVTLVKKYYKPSPLTVPLHYTDFFSNKYFVVVDSSFGNDDEVLDIQLKAEYVRFLTYSTVIPFKFAPELKMLQIELGNYAGVREVEFSGDLNVQKDSILTLSTFSDENNRLLIQNNIHVVFDKVSLNGNSVLASNCQNFLFKEIEVAENSEAKIEGITANGDVYVEGAKTVVRIVSNPKNNQPSNFANSHFNVKIKEDLYSLHNSPRNSPLLKFDAVSVENSVGSIKVSFENYNRSLFSSDDDDSVKLLTLLAVENRAESFKCEELAKLVSFEPSSLALSTEKDEVVKFSASCENGKVEVHCELEDDDDEDDDDDDDSGKSKKKKRMIALICAFGSAAIIVIVAVSVSLYLKKNYKEGDSDKAQIMTQLNPNGTPEAVI